jgi:phosphohistidine phosphatase SixA
MDNNNLERKTEATPTDDSEISSSTTAIVISPVKNKKPIGFVSHNPLLKNITKYLVEEADAEEEELLGETSGNQSKDENTFEMNKELTKVNTPFLIPFHLKNLCRYSIV